MTQHLCCALSDEDNAASEHKVGPSPSKVLRLELTDIAGPSSEYSVRHWKSPEDFSSEYVAQLTPAQEHMEDSQESQSRG